MLRFHTENQALATLAVQHRESSRYLFFDQQLRLCGRRSEGKEDEIVTSCEQPQPLAFCGIHVISPDFCRCSRNKGLFSITDAYLGLAAQGERIIAFRADECYWRDVGSLARLRQAEEDLAQQPLW